MTLQVKFRPSSELPRDILRLARDTLDLANQRAAALVKETRKRLASRISSTRKRAMKLGYRDGMRAAKIAEAAQSLRFEQLCQDLMRDANQQCLNLAVDIAQQILEREIPSTPDYLGARIAKVLAGFNSQSSTKVTTHSAQLAVIRQELGARLPDYNIAVQSDDSIEPGSARISGPSGEVVISWRDDFEAVCNYLRTNLAEQLTKT